MLLLHGFPQYSLEWAGQLACAGVGPAADGRPGPARLRHVGNCPGRSLSAYTMDELVDGCDRAMLDALGWARVDLVGHDWGAVVAWHVASPRCRSACAR